MKIGYSLSSEEMQPIDMVRWAQQAEGAGFSGIAISDHFHPWTNRQGQSPFVWNVLGALAAVTDLRIGTSVTCPTVRIHPAIIAQAAATTAAMAPGRFFFGVGSGENLNEHILGDRWPETDVRLDMLRESIEVMRKLWTGDQVSHHGEHYTVENARLYTLPDEPPPVIISGFGPKAVKLAAEIGDGYFGTSPDEGARSTPTTRRGGTGPKMALMKVCWGPDEQKAKELAHEIWPNIGVSRRAEPGAADAGALRAGVGEGDASTTSPRPSAAGPTRRCTSRRSAVRGGGLRRGVRPADRLGPGGLLQVLDRRGRAATSDQAAAPGVGSDPARSSARADSACDHTSGDVAERLATRRGRTPRAASGGARRHRALGPGACFLGRPSTASAVTAHHEAGTNGASPALKPSLPSGG